MTQHNSILSMIESYFSLGKVQAHLVAPLSEVLGSPGSFYVVVLSLFRCCPHLQGPKCQHCVDISAHRKERKLGIGKGSPHFFKSETNKLETSLLLTSCWPEDSHVTIGNCKGSWEV